MKVILSLAVLIAILSCQLSRSSSGALESGQSRDRRVAAKTPILIWTERVGLDAMVIRASCADAARIDPVHCADDVERLSYSAFAQIAMSKIVSSEQLNVDVQALQARFNALEEELKKKFSRALYNEYSDTLVKLVATASLADANRKIEETFRKQFDQFKRGELMIVSTETQKSNPDFQSSRVGLFLTANIAYSVASIEAIAQEQFLKASMENEKAVRENYVIWKARFTDIIEQNRRRIATAEAQNAQELSNLQSRLSQEYSTLTKNIEAMNESLKKQRENVWETERRYLDDRYVELSRSMHEWMFALYRAEGVRTDILLRAMNGAY